MQIANIAAGTTVLINKEIETAVQSIFIDATLAAVNTPDETLTDLKAILTAVFGSATMTVSRQTEGNTEVIHQSISIIHLLEMSTNNGGLIRVDNDDATLRVRAEIALSNDGAFKGSDNTKIIVAIAAKVSAAVYNLYALDIPYVAQTTLGYRTQLANALTDKDIDCANTSVIAWPIDETVSARLYFHSGGNVLFTVEEMKQRLFGSSQNIIACNGRQYGGYVNLACLNVEECYKITLNLATSQKLYLLQKTFA